MRPIATGARASVGGDHPELAAVAGVEDRVAAPLDRLAGGERRRLGGDVEHPGGDGDDRDRDHGEAGHRGDQQLLAGAAAAPLASAAALRHRGTGYFRAAYSDAQACVSPVEWLCTIPSTSIWLGMTTALPSPGST